MDKLIAYDEQALIFINHLNTPFLDQVMQWATKPFFWTPLFLFFIYVAWKQYKVYPFLILILFLVLGLVVCDHFTNLTKASVARFRPYYDPALEGEIRYFKRSSQLYGFYSGHAGTSMLIAVYLFRMLKNKVAVTLAFVWSAIFAFSRMYLGAHFPGDILVGATTGALWGILFSQFCKMALNYRQRRLAQFQN